MVVDWDSLPVTPAMRPGATRRSVAGALSSVVRVTTTPDALFDERSYHRHSNEQWLVVLSGTVRLKREDREFEAHPGDLVFFPAGVYHSAVAVGPDGCEYYEIFAPARFDQLPGYLAKGPLEFK